LNSLANALFVQYKSGGPEEVIEEAIALRLEALDFTAIDQSNEAVTFASLGGYYGKRFQRTEKEGYLDEGLLYFSQAVSCEDSTPAHRADSAMIYADWGRWGEACDMLGTVMDLLPHVSPRLLNNSDKQHQLSPLSGLASFSAAISLQAGIDALHALQL
jgi:hypothetical protein